MAAHWQQHRQGQQHRAQRVEEHAQHQIEQAAAHMREPIAWTADGRLCPALGKPFAFADLAAVMEHARKGRGCGKTTLNGAPAGTA